MTSETGEADYLLGHSDAEHERLTRQGARIAPLTERFFREAGIGPGQAVLDIGSGVGDVAILLAGIVGEPGKVVAVEREERAIALARRRVAQAGYQNVTFVQRDLTCFSTEERLDAIVGRYILQFLPDPSAVLRSLVRCLRPGGVVAFQEPSWVPFLHLCPDLPLWSAATSLMYEIAQKANVDTLMGVGMHRVFQEAGLPAPKMHMDVPLGHEPEFTRWVADSVVSSIPHIEKHNVAIEPLGDLNTLAHRIQAEVDASNLVVPWLGLVGAWSRTGAS